MLPYGVHYLPLPLPIAFYQRLDPPQRHELHEQQQRQRDCDEGLEFCHVFSLSDGAAIPTLVRKVFVIASLEGRCARKDNSL